MKKKIRLVILLILIAALVVIAAFIVVPALQRAAAEQTGQEWFAKQEDYLSDIQTMCESMDDVYVLYVSGGMTENDFANYLDMFQTMNQVAKVSYQQYLDDHPIKASSYTYFEKAGCEEVKKIYDDMDSFFQDSKAHIGDTDYIMYSYVAFGDVIAGHLAGYEAAKDLMRNGEQ